MWNGWERNKIYYLRWQVYDAKKLLADVKVIVDEAKKKYGPIKQPGN
jgi:hypothetical protein